MLCAVYAMARSVYTPLNSSGTAEARVVKFCVAIAYSHKKFDPILCGCRLYQVLTFGQLIISAVTIPGF